MKLYIYHTNERTSWIISKNKAIPDNMVYYTFIHVSAVPIDNKQVPFCVYHSKDDSKCIVNLEDPDDTDYVFKFKFFAHLTRQSYNTKINIQCKNGSSKITMDIPIDGWEKYITFYAMSDIKYDGRIIVTENTSNIAPVISIAMGYFNRKEQLLYTLETLKYSKLKNFEVVIADDASNDFNRLEDIINGYDFKIRIIRVTSEYKEEKCYKNPCIIYNFAFELCKSESIIIQNPECCHIGDILSYVNTNLEDNAYIVFSCLSMIKPDYNKLLHNTYKGNNESFDNFIKQISPINNTCPPWYSHPQFRNAGYHFTTAIKKKDLDRIDGFDNCMAFGYWYDDDQFIYNIKKHDMKVKLLAPKIDSSYLMSIHQWHPKFTNNRNDFAVLRNKNSNIFGAYKSQINNTITFIIPTIGRATLIRTIESLLNQTVSEWKAIIIFDGIHANIRISDSRITILEIDKKGVGTNGAGNVRNIAMDKVTTEWVAFVDDDDSLGNNYVSLFYEELKLKTDLDTIIFRMHGNDNRILLALDADNFVINNVGISFAMKKSIGIKFIPSTTEDFALLNSIRKNGHKMCISPHITYFVRKKAIDSDIKGKRAYIN